MKGVIDYGAFRDGLLSRSVVFNPRSGAHQLLLPLLGMMLLYQDTSCLGSRPPAAVSDAITNSVHGLLREHTVLFLRGRYLQMESQGHLVALCLSFKERLVYVFNLCHPFFRPICIFESKVCVSLKENIVGS